MGLLTVLPVREIHLGLAGRDPAHRWSLAPHRPLGAGGETPQPRYGCDNLHSSGVESRMSGVSGGWVRGLVAGSGAQAAPAGGTAGPRGEFPGRGARGPGAAGRSPPRARGHPPGRPACPRSLTRARAPAGTVMIAKGFQSARTENPSRSRETAVTRTLAVQPPKIRAGTPLRSPAGASRGRHGCGTRATPLYWVQRHLHWVPVSNTCPNCAVSRRQLPGDGAEPGGACYWWARCCGGGRRGLRPGRRRWPRRRRC